MAEKKQQLTDEEIEAAIEGATAGHRLAEHEPDEESVEIARRQLRGEITADEAVQQEIKRTLDEFKRD
ncbi:antitoxin VbhA family protein [Kribbella sp. NPDC048928]|uniref:antitoxin VbhA family protein n=1 Tax=Kribbella sp. NPDC048928 TaxID=3364111 RepID=UPI003724A2F9